METFLENGSIFKHNYIVFGWPDIDDWYFIFEMFGRDSQKRTIVNRLLSVLLINAAIWSFLLGITKGSKDVIGLLDYNTALFLQLAARLFSNAGYIWM